MDKKELLQALTELGIESANDLRTALLPVLNKSQVELRIGSVVELDPNKKYIIDVPQADEDMMRGMKEALIACGIWNDNFLIISGAFTIYEQGSDEFKKPSELLREWKDDSQSSFHPTFRPRNEVLDRMEQEALEEDARGETLPFPEADEIGEDG